MMTSEWGTANPSYYCAQWGTGELIIGGNTYKLGGITNVEWKCDRDYYERDFLRRIAPATSYEITLTAQFCEVGQTTTKEETMAPSNLSHREDNLIDDYAEKICDALNPVRVKVDARGNEERVNEHVDGQVDSFLRLLAGDDKHRIANKQQDVLALLTEFVEALGYVDGTVVAL